MKRYVWIALFCLIAACTPIAPTSDPYSQAGEAFGAMTATAARNAEIARYADQTEQARRNSLAQTQQAIALEAEAQTQQAAAGTATQYVSNQATQSNQTAVAAIVAGADFVATETQRPLDRYATEDARVVGLQATATMTAVEKENVEKSGGVIRGTIIVVNLLS